MLDRIIETRVHEDRDRFIQSIKGEDVCRLASSYHNGEPCVFFKPPEHGSYNICFFVRFPTNVDEKTDITGESKGGDSWVVRIPITPCLALGDREKLESEVAVMQ